MFGLYRRRVKLVGCNDMDDPHLNEQNEDQGLDWFDKQYPKFKRLTSGSRFDYPENSRLGFIVDIGRRKELPPSKWWQVLGREWSACDDIWRYAFWLKAKFRTSPQLRLNMMNSAKRAIYDSLPEILTVYRGCFLKNQRGMSWTLDLEVAKKFPAATLRCEVKGTFVW
jgi:hypothetical protein